MRIVICGSMSASKKMVGLKKTLLDKGHEAILLKDAEKYATEKPATENSRESTENKIKYDLIRDYYATIKEADAVLIANYDKNGIKNYVGGNSFLEAGFAHVLNKKLFFLNDIPDLSYTDELRAFRPIILNDNFDLINEL